MLPYFIEASTTSTQLPGFHWYECLHRRGVNWFHAPYTAYILNFIVQFKAPNPLKHGFRLLLNLVFVVVSNVKVTGSGPLAALQALTIAIVIERVIDHHRLGRCCLSL